LRNSEDFLVRLAASSQGVSSTPFRFGEVIVISHFLNGLGMLSTIKERVYLARRRLGHMEIIEFVAMLLRYAIHGERALIVHLAMA
jgi:hypothetical protein